MAYPVISEQSKFDAATTEAARALLLFWATHMALERTFARELTQWKT